MSIITEALKKAERQKDKTITSEEYIDKILGPERRGTYENENAKPPAEINPARRSGTLAVAGGLLLLAIIFLTVSNLYLLPSLDVETATPGKAPDYIEDSLKAEAYSDMGSEIALIENNPGFMGKMKKALRGDPVREQVLANFKLNGIVWDADNSWAIINNRIVRTGDTLNGAKVVSIEPKKVVLNFRNEEFDLAVK